MKEMQQLIKKNSQSGGYKSVFPKTFTDAVFDKQSGKNITEILSGFNMYFLLYTGYKESTRLQVPMSLRRAGLWITYVLYDKTVVTEWYTGEAVDDNSWGNGSNWRNGNNTLVGDISISSDGYWIINGVITNIKAQGESGITPMIRINSNNYLEVSYTNGSSYTKLSDNPVFTQFRVFENKLQQSLDLGNTWTVVSDNIAAWFRWQTNGDNLGRIQISRDNNTWENFSPEFINRMLIKGFVTNLPQSAKYGDIYMVGPSYNQEDNEHVNPYYRMWVMQDTWVDAGYYNKNTYNFSYNIKKTYPSVSEMNADKSNPIGTNGLAIQIGDIVTIVNSAISSENGIYSYEGSQNGWLLQGSFNFEVVQTTGTDINKTMSQKAITDGLALKSDKTYVDNNLNLKADKTYVDNNFAKELLFRDMWSADASGQYSYDETNDVYKVTTNYKDIDKTIKQYTWKLSYEEALKTYALKRHISLLDGKSTSGLFYRLNQTDIICYPPIDNCISSVTYNLNSFIFGGDLFGNTKAKIINIFNNKDGIDFKVSNLRVFLYNNRAITTILTVFDCTELTDTFAAFYSMPALETVYLKNLGLSISLSDSPNISKASILYIIENCQTSKTFSITLQDTAYTRLSTDSDIIAALNTYTNVTLIS